MRKYKIIFTVITIIQLLLVGLMLVFLWYGLDYWQYVFLFIIFTNPIINYWSINLALNNYYKHEKKSDS